MRLQNEQHFLYHKGTNDKFKLSSVSGIHEFGTFTCGYVFNQHKSTKKYSISALNARQLTKVYSSRIEIISDGP